MAVLGLRPGRRPMFPPADRIRPDSTGLVALGGELTPEVLIEAYRKGIFPWEGRQPIPWFSPDPRMILVPRAFRATKSLEKRDRRGTLEVHFDGAFPEVIEACATTRRPREVGTWISDTVIRAYTRLWHLGVAHSVEVREGGELVGGLYGLAMGRAFFGESMFYRRRDASKIALWHLCRRLHKAGYHFIDCQQETGHLRRLGAVAIPRLRYLRLLDEALESEDRWGAVLSP